MDSCPNYFGSGSKFQVVHNVNVLFLPQDLNIFIVGIDLGIKPETFPVIYKKNSVEFLATTDEKHELTSKLKATGFVLFKEDFT